MHRHSIERSYPRQPFLKSVVAIALCIGWISSTACQRQAPEEASRAVPAAEIKALFSQFDEGNSPGVAVAVVSQGQTVFMEGFGLADLESGVAIEPRSQFRLASVSKQFAGMAIMLLAEDGVLDYDDPITRYLPELSRIGGEISIRQLLQHTGGLPDYYEALTAATGEHWPTNEDAVQFFSDWGEPLFDPGERYEYSNPGYEMIAAIVARTTGGSFSEFMAKRIFEPLGMKNTLVFDESDPEIPHRAYGYSKGEDGEFILDDEDPLNFLTGSGGIYSTVEDLVAWDQALYGEQLLPGTVLALAFTPAVFNSGETYPYGFGWGVGSDLALGRVQRHSGGWVGFSTQIVRYPDAGFSVILLSNLDTLHGAGYARRITDLVFPPSPVVITGARVIDGTGSPSKSVSVRVEGDRIDAVGELEPRPGDLVVDAEGLVLAPGFIDTHSHADSAEPHVLAQAEGAISQGVTTLAGGPDGHSVFPLADLFDRLEATPSAVNVLSWVGHGTLRERVMGDDFRRSATEAEIDSMRDLLKQEMEAGAWGLSTGLEYDPGIYSETDEVIALAREAALHGGRYTSHIRSEDRYFWDAVEEILTIGREADIPVNITHIKLAMQSSHGKAEELLQILDEARSNGVEVTSDIYPYTYWQSTLTVLFPERDFQNPEAARFAVTEVSLPEGMLIPHFAPEPDLEGQTLEEIAALRGTEPARTLMDLIAEAEAYQVKTGEEDVETVIAVSMSEADIERLMQWPWTNICTDGELWGAHPRGYGTFSRVLGRYVRDRQALTLESAIHKMTGLSAATLGLPDRGRIEPGMLADLVLFDADTVADRATTEYPHDVSRGIETVWVNGSVVWHDSQATDRTPGRVLRRDR